MRFSRLLFLSLMFARRRNVDSYFRQILATFYTYVDNYCLRSEIHTFNAKTADTVNRLYRAAEDAGTELGSLQVVAQAMQSTLGANSERLDGIVRAHTDMHTKLASLQQMTDSAAARTTEKLDALTGLSAGIARDTADTAAVATQVVSQQRELAEQQRTLAEVSRTTLSTLQESSGILQQRMDTSLANQRSLLDLQQHASQALAGIATQQGVVQAQVAAALRGQGELLVGQKAMHEQQRALHSETMDELGSLAQRSVQIAAGVEQALAAEEQLAVAQAGVRSQLTALVVCVVAL